MAIINEVQISWLEVAGADSYRVYRATDIEGPYALIASGITDTFYVDPTGTLDYYYKVSCVDAFGGEGELSEPILPYDVADVCLIRGSVIHPDGEPADGEPLEIVYYVDAVEDLPRFAQGNLLTRKHVSAYTDMNGVFEVPVTKLALITFTIRGTGYRCRLQIPDLDSLDLENLASYGVMEKQEYPF